MLRLLNLEEIEGLCLRLPHLVQDQKQRSPHFHRRVVEWLKSFESVLAANHLAQVGLIAGIHSGLVAADHGQVPAGLEFRGRSTRGKVMVALASQALQRGAEVASGLVAENRPRFADAERVALQIVAVAESRNLVTPRPEGMSTSQYLGGLRRAFLATPDLENALVHLDGLVGPNDALIVLDRALARFREPAPQDRHLVASPRPS